MTLNDYAKFTRSTAVYPDAETGNVAELMYLALGLAGETGEVCNKIKKVYRDGAPMSDDIAGELGDCLWYWARLCDAMGVDPQAVLEDNIDKLTSRKARGTLQGSGDSR